MSNTINILIIDDSEIDRMIIRSHFKHAIDTVNIQETKDGEEALNFLDDCQDNFPDLIFVDINMPILNGFQFLEKYELVFWKQHPQTLIYIISSSKAEDDIKKSEEFTSVKGYITKPFSREKAINLYNMILHSNQTDNGSSHS